MEELGMTSNKTDNKRPMRQIIQSIEQAARDARMEDAQQTKSQIQRKGNKTARVKQSNPLRGVTKKKRRRSAPAVIMKDDYRNRAPHFDEDAEVEKSERLASGALSGKKLLEWRNRYEMMLTPMEKEQRLARAAKAKEKEKELYEILNNWAIGQPNMTEAATRSAEETDGLASVLENLRLPGKGRRRRRRRTRRRNLNKNNYENTYKQFPFVKRIRLRN